jgi:uncharacterized membrane protein YeaQ/YmgE (transglycosylase-associated protein family)
MGKHDGEAFVGHAFCIVLGSACVQGFNFHKGRNLMSVIDFLLLLLVAGICGALGQAIAGYSRGGCLVSIVLGFIGALLGIWLARLMGLPEMFAVSIGGQPFPIIWSIIGAALFVAVLSLFTARWRAY